MNRKRRATNPQSSKVLKFPQNPQQTIQETSSFQLAPAVRKLPINRPLTSHARQQSVQNFHHNEHPPIRNANNLQPISNRHVEVTPYVGPTSCHEQLADSFVSLATSNSLNSAIEIFLKSLLKASNVSYWEEIPGMKSLFSDSLNKVVPNSSGIIGFALYSDQPIVTLDPHIHPAYYSQMDSSIFLSNAPTLLFNLTDIHGTICGVVCASRPPNTIQFSNIDVANAIWFTQKFKALSPFLLRTPNVDSLIFQISSLSHLSHVCQSISSYFHSRTTEIWIRHTGGLLKLSSSDSNFEENDCYNVIEGGGIVGNALRNEESINVGSLSLSSNPEFDKQGESVLVTVWNAKTSKNSNVEILQMAKHLEETSKSSEALQSFSNSTSYPTHEKEISPNKIEILGIALRGSQKLVFTKTDEEMLKAVSPFIFMQIQNNIQYKNIENQLNLAEANSDELLALLDIIRLLASQLDTSKLPELIMQRGRQLIHADRCSLFLLDEKGYFHSNFAHGLDLPIKIPKGQGIIGKCLSTESILNLEDAYHYDFFDKSVDTSTGYRTKSVLAVPIYSSSKDDEFLLRNFGSQSPGLPPKPPTDQSSQNSSEKKMKIIGVTEMINKNGNVPFSKRDERIVQIFNVFCAIALRNATLYKERSELGFQLHRFFKVSFSLSRVEDLHRLLNDILANAREAIGAERATLFVADEKANVFKTLIFDGGSMPVTLPLDKGIIGQVYREKKPIIVNDPYSSPLFSESVDQSTGYKTKNIIAVPLLSIRSTHLTQSEIFQVNPDEKDDGVTVIGVCEMLNVDGDGFSEKDLNTLSSFSGFAQMALENSHLKDIAENGDEEFKLNGWIGPSEKNLCDKIPSKLISPPELEESFNQRNFFSHNLHSFRNDFSFHFLFYIFYQYHLLEEFKITNEAFFRFIYSMKNLYTGTPYHNWYHACDVVQYINYELQICNYSQLNIYSKSQILALFVAAICHDANHAGFTNVYNVKAHTPLGILFSSQSVMETYHCTISIPVITRSNVNLFASIKEPELQKTWQLFISLILSTDMAHHFELVKRMQEILDEKVGKGGYATNDNLKDIFVDEEVKILSLQLLLKVGDISNVSRPFEIADKWCDILNQEFFRQGDLEKEKGIGFTSPLNDRDSANKPKSQIGFYNFICLPLYQTIARLFPPLQVNVDAIQSNLEQWKTMMTSE